MLKKISFLSFLIILPIYSMQDNPSNEKPNNLITIKNSTVTTLKLNAQKKIDNLTATEAFELAPGESKTIAAMMINYISEPKFNSGGLEGGYGLFFINDSELINDQTTGRIKVKQLVTN